MEIHEFVRKAIKRVVVYQEKVELYVRRSELRDVLVKDGSTSSSQISSDDLIVLDAEAKLKRCGGEVRLVLPPNSHGEIPGHAAPSLLKAIARAHDWRERIMNGRAHDLRSIAQQTGFDQRYMMSDPTMCIPGTRHRRGDTRRASAPQSDCAKTLPQTTHELDRAAQAARVP